MLTRPFTGEKRASYKYGKAGGKGETYEDGSNWRYWLLFKNVCCREWAGRRKPREKDREQGDDEKGTEGGKSQGWPRDREE